MGKFLQNSLISFLINGADSGSEMTSAIHRAIFLISLSFMPLVVIAGVPNRTPDGLNGEFGSNGMVLRFATIPADSKSSWACFTICEAYFRNAGVMASLKATPMAAIV